MSQDIFQELRDAVVSFDRERAIEASKRAVDMGVDPVEAINKGISEGLSEIGRRFEAGELFLMHIVAAAEAAKGAIDEVLQPEISRRREERRGLGVVVLGTVEGDIHDIGKNLVAAMLFAGGFEVIDLGKDVPTEEFIKKAKEVKADIVGASALLTTTIPMQREIIKALAKEGIRDKVKVIVGGAPVTQEWADEIGADGYGADAVEAVKLAKNLLKIKE